MSQLITCRTCKQQVSYNAKFCPNCGEREPSAFVYKWSTIIFAILFLILVIYGIYTFAF
ncbi:hypothetical protein [Dyadobacter sp. CY312]|uniref:hypothetical protein n=1 Tax=Dyadobacter sp. CY312 TaxID=2907303 RepID=UPI001F19EB84|nr:hypothetical protein [Dyadobacter sp. CY312]MCE7042693.1 hypothetical protein [Dyadobacter sp. CY312]